MNVVVVGGGSGGGSASSAEEWGSSSSGGRLHAATIALTSRKSYRGQTASRWQRGLLGWLESVTTKFLREFAEFSLLVPASIVARDF